jgi:hypothetical protein
MHRRILALAFCSAAAAASAQVVIPDIFTDWKEIEAPPPPALRTEGLIPVDVSGTSLRFAVDPASIQVGTDGVVRYVVVATSKSGAVNGMYEGIRCNTGEVKTYAWHNPGSGWVPASRAQWQDIYRTPNSRHSLAIAKSGVCHDAAPNGSAEQIARDLRAPITTRVLRGGINR